jgi:hypothetical protein
MTLRSLGAEAERHFPVQNAARATYREILERRAKENSVDFGPTSGSTFRRRFAYTGKQIEAATGPF